MAADEFASVRRSPADRAASGDQRVFPHARGWLVARGFEADDACLFERYADAERHARHMARSAGGGGILFYDANGRAALYVAYPNWRQETRNR